MMKSSYEEPINLEERADIASSIGEEVISRAELIGAFTHCYGIDINAYDGFELSGIPHIAQVIMKARNVNQLSKCGCKFKFWVADLFTVLNNKLGGDRKKIETVGKYMIEVWKAAGMNMENVEFLWASEEINKRSDYYWRIVIDIARRYSLTRMKRCIPILGRSTEAKQDYDNHKERSEELKAEGKFEQACEELETANEILEHMDDNIPLSYLMYAAMQTADVFFLNAHICQLGMDQRKVNILAREYADAFNRESNPVVPPRLKPIIISHHMLMGLQQGQEKMSKSKPDSGIFVTDTAPQVKKKIRKAYCVPGDIKTNPILDYTKHIIFPYLNDIGKEFEVTRKHEADISFSTYEELETCYEKGDLHPADLKPAVTREINKLLDPIRSHFETNEYAKGLLDEVKKIKLSR